MGGISGGGILQPLPCCFAMVFTAKAPVYYLEIIPSRFRRWRTLVPHQIAACG
jgi:hypothetical protein